MSFLPKLEIKIKISRRYFCKNCGHKGRVSKDKRARFVACKNCEQPVKCNIIKN